jgi:ATP-dependent Clp protease ATP-binding subunit ClpA
MMRPQDSDPKAPLDSWQPVLIGEPGTGKTAIAEGLARRIAAGEVPESMRDKQIFALDISALIGT